MNKGAWLPHSQTLPQKNGDEPGNDTIKMAGEIVNLRVQAKLEEGFSKVPKQQHIKDLLKYMLHKDGDQVQKKKVGHPIQFGSGMASKFY